MKRTAVGRLVPGTVYAVDGQPLTFKGTRFTGYTVMDSSPTAFNYAMFGDRWVFVDSTGQELEFKKGYSSTNKAGLIPASEPSTYTQTATILG